MGSGTKPVTKVVITTVDSVTINKAFIKCFASNKNSSYDLVIAVGGTALYSGKVTNTETPVVYGGDTNTPLTGKVSYTFTGTNALNLVSLAFNEVE